MQKIICDLCKKNEATLRYRLQELKTVGLWEFGSVLPKSVWVRRDICEECFNKLFKGGNNGTR